MAQVSVDETTEKSPKKQLEKIVSVALEDDTTGDGSQSQDGTAVADDIIIEAVRLLLREFGVRKSGAAIRDSVEIPHEQIGPKEAVNALSNLGFKASFGSLKITSLAEEFFPLIAFNNNGEAFLAVTPPSENTILLLEPTSQKKFEVSLNEFKDKYSDFFIIAKQLNDREKEAQSGHWFSALKK